MTGFSRVSRDFDWGTITVEMSSVNHRYQEISLRLAKEISSFEPQINQMIRKTFRRGKIKLRADLTLASSIRAAQINSDVLESYYRQLDESRKHLKMIEEVRVESLLQLPGVMDSPSFSSLIQEQGETPVIQVVEEAINSLLEMRKKEGEHLLEDILSNLVSFEKIIENIDSYWETGKEKALDDVKIRLGKLISDHEGDLDEGRLAQEVAILADKWDISEEISRSRSHLEKFRSVLRQEHSEGRKLDFLLQEMNREINTMGSKISDSDLRWMVVEGKTYLERIREQVQNVE
jgi:uncharacterized protein (TIGR00255 family)